MIQASDLSFSYGDRHLFKNASFIIGNNQTIGIVGPNGSGKTTLLKLVSNSLEPTTGKVSVEGELAYVPQEVKNDETLESAGSVREYINLKSHHYDYQIKRFLSKLGLEIALLAKPKLLSGGQKTKLALAKALLEEPDIFLLDEPTNFMDKEGKAWVMDFLANYPKTVILISHDLALLDKSLDKVLAINPTTQEIEQYTGNYSDYIRLKKAKDELTMKKIRAQTQHIYKLQKGLSRMGQQGVRARIRQQKKLARAKLKLPEAPEKLKTIKVSLPEPARVGEIPLRAISIFKSFGEKPILTNFNFTIKRGERVALIGPNGSGKSTFLKILIGLISPDSGEVFKNENINIGYYSQEFETFDMQKIVIDEFMEKCGTNEKFARSFLARYMFSKDKVFQKINSLSGGEKTRLAIACLTGFNHNLLILDEPTTYLDVMSQRIILESLKDYKGAMIVVSHTPEFLKELSPSRAYLFPDQKMLYWDEELLNKAILT